MIGVLCVCVKIRVYDCMIDVLCVCVKNFVYYGCVMCFLLEILCGP